MIGAWSEHSDGVDPSNQNNPYSGAAYVFVRDANGAWAQQVFLKSSTSVPGWPVFTTGRFGSSVALHGRTVVVGALGEHLDPAGTVVEGQGAIYVFAGDTAGGWSRLAMIKPALLDDQDYFGSSVSFDGRTVASGTPGDDSDGSSETDNSVFAAGAVYVFE